MTIAAAGMSIVAWVWSVEWRLEGQRAVMLHQQRLIDALATTRRSERADIIDRHRALMADDRHP